MATLAIPRVDKTIAIKHARMTKLRDKMDKRVFDKRGNVRGGSWNTYSTGPPRLWAEYLIMIDEYLNIPISCSPLPYHSVRMTGVFIFVALWLTRRDPIMGLNAGFIALCCNVAVVAAVSLFTPAERGRLTSTLTQASRHRFPSLRFPQSRGAIGSYDNRIPTSGLPKITGQSV
jgi:hypothetical protein